MSENPKLIRSMQIPPIKMQQYERYLPTAFDESMSLLEKVNKVILYLHEYSEVTEMMLTRWNEVYRWLMNEGLDETVGYRLREWLDDGTLHRIINEDLLSDINKKVESFISEINSLIDDLQTMIQNEMKFYKTEFDQIGTIKFIRE